MKKLIALLLSLVMIVVLFAACNNEQQNDGSTPPASNGTEEHDPVTLHYYIAGFADQEDADKVHAEVNKLVQEIYPWITIEFHVSNKADYPTHLALAQTSGDPIDIISTFGTDYQVEMANGSYMDITDYLDDYPDMMAALPEWAYGWGQMNGRTYGITNWQQCNYGNYSMAVEKELADKYGFDVEEVNKLIQAEEFFNPAIYEKITDFFEAAYADGVDNLVLYTDYLACQTRGYEQLTGPIYFAISDDSCKLINIWETEQMEEYLEAAKSWKEAGYIPEDMFTTTNSYIGADGKKNGYSAFYFCGNEYVPNFPELRLSNWGVDLYFMQTQLSEDQYYVGYNYAAGLTCVGATSEHPEDALRFIELLYTNAEIQNMLVYGLEGEHYTKNDDGTITTLEYSSGQANAESSYGLRKYTVGNSALTWINQSFDQDFWNWAFEEMPNNAVTSNLIGFAPDYSAVSSKLGQINSIVTEYRQQLIGATAEDIDATYAEFLAKLDAAGIDSVIETLQAQVDAFLASK